MRTRALVAEFAIFYHCLIADEKLLSAIIEHIIPIVSSQLIEHDFKRCIEDSCWRLEDR